ncbi:MAG: hypothetical protein IID16_01020 [Candidatus Marinimicrobia bacterium]|nr:hypothetical protein [Candidatus Neomarinimicrobiota bacterium]
MKDQEKYLTYQLLTKRVCGLNKEDNTHKIETILVKLGGSVLLEKYCKFLSVRGYIKTDPPKIVKVLDKSGKECGKNEIIGAQEVVDKLLNVSKVEAPIDYKVELEKEKKRNDELDQRNDNLEQRLKALEMQSHPDEKLGSDLGSMPKEKRGRKKTISELKKTVESKPLSNE